MTDNLKATLFTLLALLLAAAVGALLALGGMWLAGTLGYNFESGEHGGDLRGRKLAFDAELPEAAAIAPLSSYFRAHGMHESPERISGSAEAVCQGWLGAI